MYPTGSIRLKRLITKKLFTNQSPIKPTPLKVFYLPTAKYIPITTSYLTAFPNFTLNFAHIFKQLASLSYYSGYHLPLIWVFMNTTRAHINLPIKSTRYPINYLTLLSRV